MSNRKLLEAAFVLSGKSKSEVAEELGISLNSLYRKIQESTFTQPELSQLVEILNIEDPNAIFFAKEVSR